MSKKPSTSTDEDSVMVGGIAQPFIQKTRIQQYADRLRGLDKENSMDPESQVIQPASEPVGPLTKAAIAGNGIMAGYPRASSGGGGIAAAPVANPNFADDSQAGLNNRLAAMQAKNGGIDSVTAQFNNADQKAALDRELGKLSSPGSAIAAMPAANPNFADNTQAGLNNRLAAMQAANGGAEAATAQFNNADQNAALGRALNNQNSTVSRPAGAGIMADPPQFRGVSTKPDFGDNSQAGLNSRLAAMQVANGGTEAVTASMNNEQQNRALSSALASSGQVMRSSVGVSPATAEQPKPVERDPFAYRGGESYGGKGPVNVPDSTALTPAAQGILAPIRQTPPATATTFTDKSTQPGSAIPSMIGAAPQGTPAAASYSSVQRGVSPMGIADMSPEQRFKAAGAYGDAVDKLTGVSSSGAQGIAGMAKRFDVYAKDDNALAMRNTREDLLGSGIKLERDGKGGMTITNNGNFDPIGGAQGSSINMQEGSAVLARANQARGEMINSLIKANGGNGIAALPDYAAADNAEKTQRWAMEALPARQRGAVMQAELDGQNQLAREQMRQQGDLNQRGILAGIERAKQESIDHRATDRNEIQKRGQDMNASTAANRLTSQERIAEQRTQDAGTRLTLPQRRSNFEIDAARRQVAGLSPEEIQRRTQQFSATGRENKDFDPTLAKSVSLANRRKYGADDHFDQREQSQQQAQQPAGNDGDVMTRFRGDKTMQGYKLGNQTDRGHEVLDGAGNVIGHWN